MSPQGTRLDLKSEHHSNPGSAGPAAHTCTLHCPRLCVLCQCTRLHSTLLPEARAEALRPANGQVQSRRFNPKASSLGHMPAPACSHLWSWLRGPLLCMNPPPPSTLRLSNQQCLGGLRVSCVGGHYSTSWLAIVTPGLASGQLDLQKGQFSGLP